MYHQDIVSMQLYIYSTPSYRRLRYASASSPSPMPMLCFLFDQETGYNDLRRETYCVCIYYEGKIMSGAIKPGIAMANQVDSV